MRPAAQRTDCKASIHQEEELERKFASHAKWSLVHLAALIYLITTPFWDETFDWDKHWQAFVILVAAFTAFLTIEVALCVRIIRKER